jgi:hypothetical protein
MKVYSYRSSITIFLIIYASAIIAGHPPDTSPIFSDAPHFGIQRGHTWWLPRARPLPFCVCEHCTEPSECGSHRSALLGFSEFLVCGFDAYASDASDALHPPLPPAAGGSMHARESYRGVYTLRSIGDGDTFATGACYFAISSRHNSLPIAFAACSTSVTTFVAPLATFLVNSQSELSCVPCGRDPRWYSTSR